MSRFNVKKESLSAYIQDAILCIEMGTNLIFQYAEDWTIKNQGHVLHFEGSLYKDESQTWDDIERLIKGQFTHNPSSKCIDEDSSYFEYLDRGVIDGEWVIGISI